MSSAGIKAASEAPGWTAAGESLSMERAAGPFVRVEGRRGRAMERCMKKNRIMYIEYKGSGLTGPARIGRVRFSKTGQTLYY